jgi:hypothetical protein
MSLLKIKAAFPPYISSWNLECKRIPFGGRLASKMALKTFKPLRVYTLPSSYAVRQ